MPGVQGAPGVEGQSAPWSGLEKGPAEEGENGPLIGLENQRVPTEAAVKGSFSIDLSRKLGDGDQVGTIKNRLEKVKKIHNFEERE